MLELTESILPLQKKAMYGILSIYLQLLTTSERVVILTLTFWNALTTL